MRRKKIGVVDFHGSVDITDPCYGRDTWCRMNDVKIHDGEYTCYVWRQTEKYTDFDNSIQSYQRVGIIGIYWNGLIPPDREMKEIGEIGVDSGMAGFFHNKPDYGDCAWDHICDITNEGDAWITEDGFFSCSGYGDGCYGVYAHKLDGQITALEIRFF